MHESDAPEGDDREDAVESMDDTASVVREPAADEMLDHFEKDLDDVAQALDALDADDLDTAEELTSGLQRDVELADADHEA